MRSKLPFENPSLLIHKRKAGVMSKAQKEDVQEIPSLCMNCKEEGMTRLLLTSIPHFRDIVLSHFECPHCHIENNEILSASSLAEKGVKVTVCVKGDLNKQIVKSEHAVVKLVELDFEIPASRSILTTTEGLLQSIVTDLTLGLDQREPTLQEVLKNILNEIKLYLAGKEFTLVLDDPSGNSYIEDAKNIQEYTRTKEQTEALGFSTEPACPNEDEVYEFPSTCSHCTSACETRMKMVDIPYFKEVVLMATSCDNCGYKSNEVKTGGAIAQKGKRISLRITGVEDMSRDVLKSETCSLTIPEIGLELHQGTLGGRFTTIEGLLVQVHDQLSYKVPFQSGDSALTEQQEIFKKLLENIMKVSRGELECTIIMDDPLGASYLQNLFAPDPDPNMSIEEYERTFEQNDALGLNDMKTENYQ